MSTTTQLYNIGDVEISYESSFDRIKFKYFDRWIPFSVHSFMLFLNTLSFKFLESNDEMSLTIRQFPSSIDLIRVQGNYVIIFNSSLHPSRIVLPSSIARNLTIPALMEKVARLQKGTSFQPPVDFQTSPERSYF